MIYIASDHRGFILKQSVNALLARLGYEYEDLGPFDDKSVDYPDYAKSVGEKVVASQDNRGILICGSGIGVCIAVNKIKGIRAGTMASLGQTKASVADEDTNVLCLSADYVKEEINLEIVKTFLETRFSGEERHVRRVGKITELEKL